MCGSVCRYVQESAGVYRSACRHVQECAELCRSVQEYVGLYVDMCRSVPECADVCWSVLECVKYTRAILEFAGVC